MPKKSTAPAKIRLATAWLGGCSGCHMSFLDLDEKLIDLFEAADLVYSPIADIKEFPENVDVTLVEGAIANVDHIHLAKQIRANSKIVVSFGDCAVTGNVLVLRNKLGVEDLLTFSVGFEDQPEEKGSEFEYSDQVVERYATKHHKYRIANDQVLKRLPEAVDNMAEPMFGQDAVAFYLLSEQVSKSVKVVQSGQGADEVFAGYFWHQRMAADAQGDDLDRFRRHYVDRDHAEFAEMLGEGYGCEDATTPMIEALLGEPGADDFIDRVLRAEATTLVTDDPVKRVDNMTMAWGLEARVPFLDHQLVEIAAQMPPQLKLASGGKHVLKHIARGLLPDAVIDRPKGYFPVPAFKRVRGPFLEFVRDTLQSQRCIARGLYRRAYVERLLAEPERHFTRIEGSKLWHLALLEYWLQRNVDGA